MLEREREEYINLLAKAVQIILDKLKGKVERISLFGSHSRRADLFTDLDLLIIWQTDKPFLERLKELYSLLALPVDVDILCYTPAEFERMKKMKKFQKFFEKEVVLYERGRD